MEIRIKCKGYKDKGKTYKIKINSGAGHNRVKH